MVQWHPLQPGGWIWSSGRPLRMGLYMIAPGRSLHGHLSSAMWRAASGRLPQLHEEQPASLWELSHGSPLLLCAAQALLHMQAACVCQQHSWSMYEACSQLLLQLPVQDMQVW